MDHTHIEEPKPVSNTIPVYAWVVLAGVWFASLAVALSNRAFFTALPSLRLRFDLQLIEWFFWLPTFTGVVAALPAGRLVRRPGIRLAGSAGLVCLGLGFALAAAAQTGVLALAGLAVAGLGAGVLSVIAPAAIASWFPARRQGLPMGLWLVHSALVQLGFPLLVALLALVPGGYGFLWAPVVFAAGALAFFSLLVRDPAPAEDEPGRPPAGSGRRLRNVLLLALANLCVHLVYFGVTNSLTVFWFETGRDRLAILQFAGWMLSLGFLFAAPLFGGLRDWLGFRRRVPALLFGLLGVTVLFPFTVSPVLLLVVSFAMAVFAGGLQVYLLASVREASGRVAEVGPGMAWVVFAGSLGVLAGTVGFNPLANAVGWPGAGYAMLPACVVGALAVMRLDFSGKDGLQLADQAAG